jgi:HSP20 family protein
MVFGVTCKENPTIPLKLLDNYGLMPYYVRKVIVVCIRDLCITSARRVSMPIVKWDPLSCGPLRELSAMQDRMNRLFQDALARTKVIKEGLEEGDWTPPVDIYETTEDLVIKAELPGLSTEDVNVRVKDDVLTLKGERKREEGVGSQNYHLVERCYGNFQRSFVLPSNVDRDNVQAKFKDGVLFINIPKLKRVKPKKIAIEVE